MVETAETTGAADAAADDDDDNAGASIPPQMSAYQQEGEEEHEVVDVQEETPQTQAQHDDIDEDDDDEKMALVATVNVDPPQDHTGTVVDTDETKSGGDDTNDNEHVKNVISRACSLDDDNNPSDPPPQEQEEANAYTTTAIDANYPLADEPLAEEAAVAEVDHENEKDEDAKHGDAMVEQEVEMPPTSDIVLEHPGTTPGKEQGAAISVDTNDASQPDAVQNSILPVEEEESPPPPENAAIVAPAPPGPFLEDDDEKNAEEEEADDIDREEAEVEAIVEKVEKYATGEKSDEENAVENNEKVSAAEKDEKDATAEKSGDELTAEKQVSDVDNVRFSADDDPSAPPPTSSDSSTEEEEYDQTTSRFFDEEMPLFRYTRLHGCLPRPPPVRIANIDDDVTTTTSSAFAQECLCSVMGKVVLNSENLADASGVVVGGVGVGGVTSGEGTVKNQHEGNDAVLREAPFPIVAMGFRDGTIRLLDPQNGEPVARSNQLSTGNDGTRHPIIGLCFDASGCILAALDTSGMCSIFEIRYKIGVQRPSPTQQTTSAAQQQQQQQQPEQTQPAQPSFGFSSLMSAFTGASQAPSTAPPSSSNENNQVAAQNSPADDASSDETLIRTLQVASVQVQRVAYPKNFGRPTCLALDPAYRRKREKTIMVGFSDGRLVVTKRGILFQRRNDSVIYQASLVMGIEALAWRGSLVAWADGTGVRILDSETLQRIAHVDRPTGARPNLYPSVQNMRPTLCFETSHDLLIAWGDCLLQLRVHETLHRRPKTPQQSNDGTTAPNSVASTSEGERPAVVRRRTVSCTMAWELDCIACGMAPLDDEHVLVLGLVSPIQTEDEVDDENRGRGGLSLINDVELQVVAREDGAVVYSDLLPLIRKPPNLPPSLQHTTRHRKIHPESAAPYSLLSSFALPRMDDNVELLEETPEAVDEYDPYSLFGGSGNAEPKTFKDPHLRWNLNLVSYEEQNQQPPRTLATDGDSKWNEEDLTTDAGSVDSDDYEFIMRPFPTARGADDAPPGSSPAGPPTLVIVSAGDAVAARLRSVDDAIQHALDDGRPALALKRAIRHLTRLQRYDLDYLVGRYFTGLLRATDDDAHKDGNVEGKEKKLPPQLSLRRMKLAAAAMPVLFGGNVDLWTKWATALEDIPGALFVVRTNLPVRDPVLPKEFYERALRSMFSSIMEMRNGSSAVEYLAIEAEKHFILSLLLWGTSHVLKEHVKFYKYMVELDPGYLSTLKALEDSLRLRSEQTAAVYLSFPAKDPLSSVQEVTSAQRPDGHDFNDALYDIASVTEFLEPNGPAKGDFGLGSDAANSLVSLDAKAKLNMMKGLYHETLRYLLTLGGLYASSFEEIEQLALKRVQTRFNTPTVTTEKHPYAFVLLLIQDKDLHQCLLDEEFISLGTNTMPLFALIRLVGLDLAGDFLIEHCVAPQKRSARGSRHDPWRGGPSDKTHGERRGTLPIDEVANQLGASSKILHWYLHCVFIRKPDIFVKFPNTANPPASITTLHRKAIELYVKYAGYERDSARALRGVETYRVAEVTTRFMSFLRVVLQLGGISPTEVVKMLQVERKGGVGVSRIFALELAYIMEQYGEDHPDDSRLILDLYLKGAQSLMLAVSYAQRAQPHSLLLWEILIDHCLYVGQKSSPAYRNTIIDGALFGRLLEAAALSGADLATLVARIPPGMSIEGLRPRLVAAVGDYRMKVKMHEEASEIATGEKIDLLRELGQRSRRGVRCLPTDTVRRPAWVDVASTLRASHEEGESTGSDDNNGAGRHGASKLLLPAGLRPKQRPYRSAPSINLTFW